MSSIIFSSSHAATEASAVKHLSNYCFEMDVRPGQRGELEFITRLCKIGSSTVSLTTSLTGWAYKARSEADGFLFTIPQSGVITWETSSQRTVSKVGTVSLLDHRQVNVSSYSQNTRYVTIYLSQEDYLRYLALLNGEPPLSRVLFTKMAAGEWAASFMAGLAESIICAASNSALPESKLLTHLKESLLCFTLYNIENNYSKDIRSTKNVLLPTPYCIKRAAEYIQANYMNTQNLSDIAAFAAVSIRSLQLGFKQFKDTTPMAYLREVRLNKANAMLSDARCSLTLKEVAVICGFSNFYLFNKYYLLKFSERPIDTMRRRAVI